MVHPHYFTVATSEEELVQLALSCFGPSTRLSLWTPISYDDLKYLTDQSVVGKIEELCINFCNDSGSFSYELNNLLSSSKQLVLLHISYFHEVKRCVLEELSELNLKSLPSSLTQLHIMGIILLSHCSHWPPSLPTNLMAS